MAAKPQQKPTPDEIWLGQNFKVDLGKLDEDQAEGGKKRKEFLKDLGMLKVHWQLMAIMVPIALKEKVKADDQDKKKAMVQQLGKDLAKVGPLVDKFDMKAALKLALKCENTMQLLLARMDRSGSTLSEQTGENLKRIAGYIVR